MLKVGDQEKDRKIILREERLKNETKKKPVEVSKTEEEKSLIKVMMKIRLKIIDIYEGVIVEALLDSAIMELMMSSEFVRKQGFKL